MMEGWARGRGSLEFVVELNILDDHVLNILPTLFTGSFVSSLFTPRPRSRTFLLPKLF